MAGSLTLNQVYDEFGGDTLNRIAAAIGESPAKIKAALSGVVPALMGGIADKAQTPTGANELLGVIQRDHLDTPQYDHVADAIREPGAIGNLMNTGGPLLDTVLPNKTGAVSNWVATNSGMSSTNSRSLMALTLPLLLGMIGRRNAGAGATGLMGMLGKPLGFLSEAPAGLSNIVGPSVPVPPRETVVTGYRQETNSLSWLWPFLAGLAIAGLGAWALWPRRLVAPAVLTPPVVETPPVVTTPPVITPPPVTPAVTYPNLGAFNDARLPNGVVLHIPSRGVEHRLLAFIQDPNKHPNSSTWFSFDRLQFDTDSANLRPTSEEQIKNVAEIMTAYPHVDMKIGGYTDNTGDAQHNLELSQERANTAMNGIIHDGIDAGRLTATGYGEEHPVASNGTAEGRQENRRIDMNVTEK